MDAHLEYDNSLEASIEFNEMGFNDDLLRGIYAYGLETPYQIQMRILNLVIQGQDVLAQSHSGTGKTCALSIGVLSRIDPTLKQTQAIIISSTRELASSFKTMIMQLGSYLNISCICVNGDIPMAQMVKQIEVIPHIIVGTPKKIHDITKFNVIDLSQVRIIAMDEVDVLVQLGFSDIINQIIQLSPVAVQIVQTACSNQHDEITKDKQFSKSINKITVNSSMLTLDRVKQFYMKFIGEEDKIQVLKQLYKQIKLKQSIIYCNNEGTVEELYDQLITEFKVIKLLKSMSEQQKHIELQQFQQIQGVVNILISDHIVEPRQLAMVINYSFPIDKCEYIHRVGRQGNVGGSGFCMNLVTPMEIELMLIVRRFYNTPINEFKGDLTELRCYLGYGQY